MANQRNGISVQLGAVSHCFLGAGLVLKDIHLEIPAGEFVSILGPSGCGKSTLLRIIAELENADEGTLRFGSNSTGHMSHSKGFVFQEPRLLPWLSVLENVRLPLDLRAENRQIAQEKAIGALRQVGLGDSLKQFPSQLSGGMKMRTSVARALVFEPSLLLLDEPFSALDEYSRNKLQDDLRLLWSALKMTVVFVTHSISEAVYLSNRAIVLSQKPAQILNEVKIELPVNRGPEIRMEQSFSNEMKKVSQYLSIRDML